MASASRSTRSMLPMERGANIAATSGADAAKAPPGAGPWRVRAEEALRVVRFSAPCPDAPMGRGPSAYSYCPRGAPGISSLGQRIQRRWRRKRDPWSREGSLRCWSSTGGKWSAGKIEEAPFKEGCWH
jgi:hypothetical protein